MSDFESDLEEEVNENIISNDSDVEETDVYDDNDLFGKNNEKYMKAPPFPSVKCPSDESIVNYEYNIYIIRQ